MKVIDELRQKQNRLTASMRQLLDAPKGQGGDLSDEQQQQFDGMKAEAEVLERQITRQQTVDDMERRQQGQQITSTGDNRFDEQCRSFSVVRAIAGAAGLDVDDGREREISRELSRRSGRATEGIQVPLVTLETRTTLAGGNGGNLVPTDQVGFIDALRPRLVVGRLGATIINGLSGNVAVPRRTGSVAAQWVAENEPLVLTDQTFDQVTMTPRTCGAITELSRLMLLQSSPGIEELTRSDLLATSALAVDLAAIFGTGADAEPRGVYYTPGVDTLPLTGPTWAEVLAFPASVETANTVGTGWAMHPMARALLRSTLAVAGDAGAGFLMTGPGELAGYRAEATASVPTNLGAGTNEAAVVFGAWQDLILGYWGDSYSILVNPYASDAYRRGNVQVRVMVSADVAVRHPESFVKGSVVLP